VKREGKRDKLKEKERRMLREREKIKNKKGESGACMAVVYEKLRRTTLAPGTAKVVELCRDAAI